VETGIMVQHCCCRCAVHGLKDTPLHPSMDEGSWSGPGMEHVGLLQTAVLVDFQLLTTRITAPAIVEEPHM
jgi:hypothetical protein